jgi:hypothetical protein
MITKMKQKSTDTRLAADASFGLLADMSLTSLIARPYVAARIDDLVPRYMRTHPVPMLVPSVWPDASLIGTAYDYALRIELQARYPHAEVLPWIAEDAVADLEQFPFLMGPALARGALGRARRVVAEAKEFAQNHVAGPEAYENVAAHALRLAKLDPVVRQHFFDDTFAHADAGAVAEVAALLRVTPFEKLGHPAVLKLNPVFGAYSEHVGGADADIIAGSRIIDVKVRSLPCVERVFVRQLVGYLMLANSVNKLDGSMPRLEEISIYFARHAFLWSLPTRDLFAHPAYHDTEQWLVNGAWLPWFVVDGRPLRANR